MTKFKRKKFFIRHLMTAVLLIPFILFFLPPSMELRLYFRGVTKEGVINVYRSDDAVGYYFRSIFRVTPSTTSAYMKGVHENLTHFRVRFSNLSEITLDRMTMDLYGMRVAQMTGRQMAEQMTVKKGVEIIPEAGDRGGAEPDGNLTGDDFSEASVRLQMAYDGAYFFLAPQTYMHAGAWLYYFTLLFLIALLVAWPVTGVLFLLGIRNPLSEVLFLATPAFAVAFGELACGSVSAIPFRLFFLNYFAILGIAVILRFLTRRRFASACTGVVFCCVYIANHFVFLFRGRPLLPWDFQAIGTAAEVAGAYTFVMDARLVVLICVAAFLFVAPDLLRLKKTGSLDSFDTPSPLAPLKKNILREIPERIQLRFTQHRQAKIAKHLCVRLCGVLAGILMIVLSLKSPSYERLSADAWDASIVIDYQKQGMPMTFVKFMDVYRVSEPDGYGEEILDDIAAVYGSSALNGQTWFLPEGTKITTKPQRILMVMNESLSEISYANAEEAERADTLPYLRSLTDNTIRGSLYVSVRGGGTCNTEFESLTASAMGLLPPNTYPYEAYLKRQTASLASYFSNEGYAVAALHLADRKNWKRSTVYPYLGLDPFYAYNDYRDIRTLRGYATDVSDYEKLVELDELMRGERDDRNFIYNVTMQNHGGYSLTDDMNVTVDLSAFGDFEQAEVYYSLMKLSDSALRDLIEHYRNDGTDTMIIVYGDHQPSLGTKTDDFLFDEDPPALVKYETPFVIWANYDLPSLEGYRMSANYLPGLILEAAGYELTPYLRLSGACYRRYPVITSYGVLDSEGNYYADAEAVPDENGLIQRYRCAQYNNLFDTDRRDFLFLRPQSP